MLLDRIARASTEVAGTSSRTAKLTALAACLREATTDEAPIVAAYLGGELRQRRTGVGWASLRALPAPATAPSLTVVEVDRAFEAMAVLAGPGSATRRQDAVAALFARATAAEQRLLAGLVSGELRQGAAGPLVVDALARAHEVSREQVRRAVMLEGGVGPVAAALAREGVAGLAEFGLRVGTPVQPMLAQPGTTVGSALERLGEAQVEWKLDGIRVQVHIDPVHGVRVFSRSLDDLTERLPDVVEQAGRVRARSAVLDGEAIALDPAGRPRPFQETGSRVGSVVDVTGVRQAVPLHLFAFDLLHLDGLDLLDEPARRRTAALTEVVPEDMRVPSTVTSHAGTAELVLAAALEAGHEGVVLKSTDAPYAAGRRGGAWLKVKPVHTVDLVVLAAEWGHGRRTGWLSNLHLGALGPDGAPVMLGKTFKGLTDAMLAWQTERLLELAVERDDWLVTVRPELVVEVAFDGLQTSRRYPGGVALRFARVVRHRTDKTASEVDTLDAVLQVAGHAAVDRSVDG